MSENYYYVDEDKTIIKEKLLTDEAKQWAKKFIRPDGERTTLKSAQLRKFYNEVKALEDRIEVEGFDKIKPLVKMMKSKAAYSCPRNERDRKIPEVFKDYITSMVDNINDYLDFKAFALSFEAVVGFFYGEGGR